MAYPYDDRTTRYDPHDSYGRHEHYGSGYDSGYGVSHSHSYGHHEYEYPSQQHRRYRNPPASAPAPAEYDYDHGHGQYDYPTGVATPSAAALYAGSDPYGASHWEGQNYQADPYTGGHSHSDPSTHGAGYVGSNPSAYGEVYNDTAGAHGAGYDSGPPNVEDVYHADETFGRNSERDRKKRPKLLGTAFCFLLLAGIGVACGVMLAVVFIRPPNVGVAGYAAPSIFIQDQALMVNTTVYAAVSNPNSIGAKVKHMHATIYERNQPDHVLGTSRANDLQIGSHSNTTVMLPVQFQVASTNDLSANAQILQDVAQSCGWDLGGLTGAIGNKIASKSLRGRSQIPTKRSNAIPLLVDLDIKVSVMAVDFHTPIHNLSLDVACPSLSNLLGNAGGSGSSSSATSSSSSSSSSSTVVVEPTYSSSSATSSSTSTSTSTLMSATSISSSRSRTSYTYVPPITSTYIQTLTQTVAPSTITYPSFTPTFTSTYGSSTFTYSTTAPVDTTTPVPSTTYSPSITTTYIVPTTTARPTSTSTNSPQPSHTTFTTPASLPPPISQESSQNPTQSAVSSIISSDPNASSASVNGHTSALSSIVSNDEGGNNAWSNIWSFITAGSMPIRRTMPTARPV